MTTEPAVTEPELVLRCTGRAVDHDTLTSVGDECGRVFRRPGFDTLAYRVFPAAAYVPPATNRSHMQAARAAGWSIGETATGLAVTCNKCRRPDRTTVNLCRELMRSA